jgi:hypothetical protein
MNNRSEEGSALWNKLNNISKERLQKFDSRADISTIKRNNKNLVYHDDEEFEYYYVKKFFDKICKNLTIVQDDGSNAMIVFLLPPSINYLSLDSKNEFERNVNRESRYSKLYSLICQTEYFIEEINFYRNSKSNILSLVNKIDFQLIGYLTFIFSLIVNIGYLSVSYDKGKHFYGGNNVFFIIKMVTIPFLLFNFIFIIIWLLYKLPLYLRIENKKLLNKIRMDGKDSINILSKFWILLYSCFFQRNEIFLITWIFICILIGEIINYNHFAFNVSILCVFQLSIVFSDIFRSITLKAKSLAWVFFFMFIIMYVFASWGYFFEQDRFISPRFVIK